MQKPLYYATANVNGAYPVVRVSRVNGRLTEDWVNPVAVFTTYESAMDLCSRLNAAL